MSREIIIEFPGEPISLNTMPKFKGELVRCKDCKWFSEKGFCKHPNGGAGNIRPSDWFCADGEWKE